ncbi:trans-aconitate 2-methyltransferase [Acidiferrobacter sp.]|uniref:class I SAM-dependent methyltransferase n=1 Tax=Acidiferrobacter sp. TaxID=1872107 RepID=UPI002633AA5E|nr:class I SAM-dependent methyltransferase [Acidiferrobacter sp.]
MESTPATPTLRDTIMKDIQGAVRLSVAYIGLSAGLLQAAERLKQADAAGLAQAAGGDLGYVVRWCDAAYAFGLLDETPGGFVLTDLGRAFLPDAPGTLMPFAVQEVLTAHIAERAAGLTKTGERPGEAVLAERATILPWFGPMLEAQFGPVFEKTIMPALPVYERAAAQGGLVIDLGCGNGWYLMRLARAYPRLRCLGIDGFDENVRQGQARAQAAGLADRVRFAKGDIYGFESPEPADIIALNRALHHVWDEKETVFRILHDHLKPGGAAVIWEPHWPAERAALREPARRMVAFQNLTEHVQGNHFLQPSEIAAAFRGAGLVPEVRGFLEGREAVVVGTRP